MPVRFRCLAALAAWTAFLPAAAQDGETIERKPLAIGTKIETGQIIQGEPDVTSADPDKFYLSQIGVNLTQEITVNRRLEMKVGVGGVFFYSFPINRGNAGSQGTKFGPSVSQAQALYRFGEPDAPVASLRVGYFPYKYNPDAKNLGEYLFRSMPYPTFAFTGGWAITDNALAKVQGLQFTYSQLDGKLRHDFLLTSERDFRPQGDFTPSYLANLDAGPLQFGTGVSLFHFLPIEKERTESRNMADLSVIRFSGFPAFTAVTNYTDGKPDPGGPVRHTRGPITMTASDLDNLLYEADAANNPDARAVFSSDPLENEAILRRVRDSLSRDTVTLTMQGVKLMARASFDIQKILPMPALGDGALKIYGEIAMLGTRNQPGFFEKRWERVPMMFGINLPTFRLLDALSFETEYFPSSLPDNFDQLFDNNYPTYASYSLLFHDSRKNRRDDWKWSLYANRKVATGMSLVGQVANDHFRTINQMNLFTGQSIMRKPSNWYYVVALNFGI